jgi:ribosome biogenesis GTPase
MKSTDETLEELGWNAFFSEQVSAEEALQCHPVRVMAVHRGKIAVTGAGSQHSIAPYIPDAQPSDDHPTVGDWLLIDEVTLQPTRVLRRLNLFKRRAPANARREQMIAANVDTRAIEPGLRVETVNGRDPASVSCLATWCGKGETVALLGSSGVGKSTLVNTLRGSDGIATQAIRAADGTGRHTTTVREMHRLDRGGWLLDTPGMRELHLSDAATGISEVFDDILLVAQGCRFSDCAHGGEPGCAVRAAISGGTLTSERVNRWRQLAAQDGVARTILTRRKPPV